MHQGQPVGGAPTQAICSPPRLSLRVRVEQALTYRERRLCYLLMFRHYHEQVAALHGGFRIHHMRRRPDHAD